MRTKFIILILISLILICGCIEEIPQQSPQQSIDLSNYAYLPGRSGGQVLTGGINIGDDLFLNSTSQISKTDSNLYLQPDGGNIVINPNNKSAGTDLSNICMNIATCNVLNGATFNGSTFSSLQLIDAASGRFVADGFNFILMGLNGQISNYELGGISFSTNSLQRMNITQDGNVGIGTTTPKAKVEVTGNISLNSIIALSDAVNLSYMQNAIWNNATLSGAGDVSWNTSYLLRSGALPMTGNLTMDGYNISDVKMIVALSDAVNLSYVESVNQSVLNNLTNYAYLPGRSGGQVLTGGTNANDDLILNGTSSATKTTSYVLLQPDGGNVGINTFRASANYPPSGLLDIFTSVGYEIIFNGTSHANIYSKVVGGSLYISSNSGPLYLGATADATHLAINKSGNISIGTIFPTAQLHTTGEVRFAKFGAGTATFDVGGNISSVSDEKYKTNIIPFTLGLSAILNTNPKSFKYNSASGLDTNSVYTGFVSQDLQKSIPQAVYSKPDVKYEQVLSKKATEAGQEDEYTTVEVPLGTYTLSIDDRAIIATLVNAVKEQQLQINDLKSRIDKLEGRKP